jgi:hypothetical protein
VSACSKTRPIETHGCDVSITSKISLPPQSDCLQASDAVRSRYITTVIELRLHKSFLVLNSRPEAGGRAEIMGANFAYWFRKAQAK